MLTKSDVWVQAQRIWQQRNPTRTLKGGPWMIKAAKCRCMKKSVPNVCSCPICCELLVNLKMYQSLRPAIRAKSSCTCQIDAQTKKQVCEQPPYSIAFQDIDTMEAQLMCEPQHIRAFDIPAINPLTCDFIPDVVKQFKIRKKCCHAHGQTWTPNDVNHLETEFLKAKNSTFDLYTEESLLVMQNKLDSVKLQNTHEACSAVVLQ